MGQGAEVVPKYNSVRLMLVKVQLIIHKDKIFHKIVKTYIQLVLCIHMPSFLWTQKILEQL